jgi:hypothetical protein
MRHENIFQRPNESVESRHAGNKIEEHKSKMRELQAGACFGDDHLVQR